MLRYELATHAGTTNEQYKLHIFVLSFGAQL